MLLHCFCIVPASLPPLPQMRVDHRNGTLHFGSQQLESDKVRSHLSLLAKRLAKAAAMTDPAPAAAAEQQRAAVLALCRENIAKEHSRLLARKQVRGFVF
jgi:translation initiation factor 3 subunit A